MNNKIRLDKYLWAIRIFKTRSLAAEACDKGKVKWKENSVKASKIPNIGDEYDIKTETRKWKIIVNGLIEKRVAYSEAIKYYTDITPVEENAAITFKAASFHTGKILSKIGRPTKKQRRDFDNFINTDNDDK
jgi:ribosome-associated heat shock protein Hsp15